MIDGICGHIDVLKAQLGDGGRHEQASKQSEINEVGVMNITLNNYFRWLWQVSQQKASPISNSHAEPKPIVRLAFGWFYCYSLL